LGKLSAASAIRLQTGRGIALAEPEPQVAANHARLSTKNSAGKCRREQINASIARMSKLAYHFGQ
jgi:hypothetical protein